MVSLAVFLLLVFGAGGMGCQRCSCSGRVSILLLDDGCCNRGSDCMDVMSVCKHEPILWMPRMYDAVVGWQCRGVDSPPGWLSGNCAVLRV